MAINPLPQIPQYEIQGIDALKIQNAILARQDAEQKAEAERQNALALQQAFQDYSASPTNLKALNLARMAGPKVAESLKPHFEAIASDQRESVLKGYKMTGAGILNALSRGDVAVAQKIAQDAAEAAKNSGNEQDFAFFANMAQGIGKDQGKSFFDIGVAVAGLPGGDKVLESIKTAEEIRASQHPAQKKENELELVRMKGLLSEGRITQKEYNDWYAKWKHISPGIGLMLGGGMQAPGAAQNYAERLVKGLEPWPGVMSIRTDPVVREGVQIARTLDPEFNTSTHANRQKTQQAFTTGRQGDVANALNTGMGHLSELSDLGEQLGNGNLKLINMANNLKKRQTGDPIISRFDTTKKAVADEVTRVWRGTGGSEKDIQEALSNLDPSLSPAQLRGNILQLTKLMSSKQKALEDQYRKGMGKFGDLELLDEEAKAGLEKIQRRAGEKPKTTIVKQEGYASPDDLMKALGLGGK